MSESKQKGLVPELRFPEFKINEEWNEKLLNEITTSVFDGTHQTPKYKNHGVPFFSVENIVSGKLNKFISEEDHLLATKKNRPSKNDVIITRIGNIGFSTVVAWAYDFSIYVTLAVVKQDQRFNSYFLHSYFQSEIYQQEIRSKSLLSAVPCKINMEELRNTKVNLPSLKEQKKIAACLSSLDELINANNDRLDSLKAHKKGLMQQLFPVEGETIPKLRFPEFQECGEWELTTVGEVGKFYYGKSAPKWSLSEDAPTPCVRYGELYTKFEAIIHETLSRTNIEASTLKFSKGGEILVPRVGEDPLEFASNCTYLPIKNIAIGEMISVYETKQNAIFYTYYFRTLTKQFSRVVEGQNVKNLYYVNLEPIEIGKPIKLEEQKKIANCLISLDNLISIHNDKLKSLKVHKKGLMQQLFPSMDKANE